jgi:predicted phage baseplate assembly protein
VLLLESRPAGVTGAEPQRWTTVADLLRHSGPDDRHVVVETEHDGSVRLRFGDDRRGRRPAEGTEFLALARIGNPLAGNVGAESIAHLVGDDPALIQLDGDGLRNPLPAAGGVAPEQAAQLRRRAPQAFRRQERAVTPEDYAAMAERFPGVQRASARLRWTGSWHTVFLTVDRLGGQPMDRPFAAALLRHLETYRMAGVDLEIEEPLLAPLELALQVCVRAGHQRAHVRAALMRALGAQRLPEGGLGYFHPDRWSFGQTVVLSGIEAAARAVAGVAAVRATTFQRQGKADPLPLQKGYLSLAAREIARLDNDRNHPDRGVLRLELHGGN